MSTLRDISIEKLLRHFTLFGDWTERYRFIIDLGRKLPPMDDALKTEETRVRGCQSQVWLVAERDDEEGTLSFVADSDAHIVRGLAAVLLILYSGKTPEEILAVDAEGVLSQLGLDQHLSPSRANGVFSMVGRIRDFARSAA
jgi:cysteine desulfuration protein SufE